MSSAEAFSIPIGKTSDKIFLKHNGRDMNLEEWSKELGIKKHTLHSRWRRGWNTNDILSRALIPAGCKRKYIDLKINKA